jgi:hypothetical protein
MIQHKRTITLLVLLVAILAGVAGGLGILSQEGPGQYEYQSIRGETVTVYGQGIYKHMSADVAIQGIAQDYVTVFAGIPLLLLGLYLFRRKSLRGSLLLAGVLMYFLVTYLFYTAMAMYNALFLCYVSLLGLSFFGLVLTILSYYQTGPSKEVFSRRLMRIAGVFLVANSLMVALLWLGVVVPPLLAGSVYPKELQHYTTLIVQGFDLGLLLPIGVVLGFLAFRKNLHGYVLTTIYLVFLTLLMAALVSKIAFMARAGVNVVPAVFIMPTVFLISALFSVLILKKISARSRRGPTAGIPRVL